MLFHISNKNKTYYDKLKQYRDIIYYLNNYFSEEISWDEIEVKSKFSIIYFLILIKKFKIKIFYFNKMLT